MGMGIKCAWMSVASIRGLIQGSLTTSWTGQQRKEGRNALIPRPSRRALTGQFDPIHHAPLNHSNELECTITIISQTAESIDRPPHLFEAAGIDRSIQQSLAAVWIEVEVDLSCSTRSTPSTMPSSGHLALALLVAATATASLSSAFFVSPSASSKLQRPQSFGREPQARVALSAGGEGSKEWALIFDCDGVILEVKLWLCG